MGRQPQCLCVPNGELSLALNLSWNVSIGKHIIETVVAANMRHTNTSKCPHKPYGVIWPTRGPLTVVFVCFCFGFDYDAFKCTHLQIHISSRKMHTEILLLRAGSIERHENNHNEKKIARIVVVRPEHILFWVADWKSNKILSPRIFGTHCTNVRCLTQFVGSNSPNEFDHFHFVRTNATHIIMFTTPRLLSPKQPFTVRRPPQNACHSIRFKRIDRILKWYTATATTAATTRNDQWYLAKQTAQLPMPQFLLIGPQPIQHSKQHIQRRRMAEKATAIKLQTTTAHYRNHMKYRLLLLFNTFYWDYRAPYVFIYDDGICQHSQRFCSGNWQCEQDRPKCAYIWNSHGSFCYSPFFWISNQRHDTVLCNPQRVRCHSDQANKRHTKIGECRRHSIFDLRSFCLCACFGQYIRTVVVAVWLLIVCANFVPNSFSCVCPSRTVSGRIKKKNDRINCFILHLSWPIQGKTFQALN